METEQQQLRRMMARSVLPQVMLFHGLDREKGMSLLTWLLQLIFCQDTCGKCVDCKQITAGKHTDVRYFNVREKKFGAQEAGKLQEFTRIRSYAAARVVVIFDAHLMTKQAANKLLKTLEEPSGYVFLFSAQKETLLPTVRSRCFHFFIAPTADITIPYCQEVNAILTAPTVSKAMDDTKALAKKGCSLYEFLQAFEVNLHTRYRKHTAAKSVNVRELRRHLHSMKRLARQQANLNFQFCVETLLPLGGL